MKTIGLISANYVSGDFGDLAKRRTLASIPFGGRYRLIDFALSNMCNSGITTVGVIAPYNSSSIIDHIGVGRPWSMDRKVGGMFVMPGSVYGITMTGNRFLMKDIISSKQFIVKDDADYVIITGSSDVYSMDYRPLIEQHAQSGNPITMVVKDMPEESKLRGFFVKTDDDGMVTEMSTSEVRGASYFMDCFIVDRTFLVEFIDWFEALEYLDFMDIISDNLHRFSVGTYKYEGYLGKISSLKDYWHTNLDMLDAKLTKQLFPRSRTVYTKIQDEAPTHFKPTASVKNAMIATGCEIEGKVDTSIVFRSTKIEKKATVKKCVVMQHCEIGEGAYLENVILDKYVTVKPGVRVIGSEDEPIVIGKGRKI